MQHSALAYNWKSPLILSTSLLEREQHGLSFLRVTKLWVDNINVIGKLKNLGHFVRKRKLLMFITDVFNFQIVAEKF